MSSGVATTRIALPPASGDYRTPGKWLVAGSVMIGTFLRVAALALTGLVVWEMFFTDEPVVDFRLFRNVPLSVGCGLGVVIGFALFGSSFLLPQLTRNCCTILRTRLAWF